MASLAFVIFIFCLHLSFRISAAGTNCNDLKVQPINKLPKAYLKGLNIGYYKKFTSAGGIPIMGPSTVSDYALKECARIIRSVVGRMKPEFVKALLDKHERVSLWASKSTACDIPEVKKPCDLQKFKGGMAWNNILILQETSFECDQRGNAWIGRVLVHEFYHAIHGTFDQVDKKLSTLWQQAYDNAKKKHLWPADSYALKNKEEYFAGGGQAWFGANEMDTCGEQKVCNSAQLKKKDPKLYDLVARVYKKAPPTWMYQCKDTCNK